MAAKAWASQQKPVEETFFSNEAVSLCLLINRRVKTMRIIDFRAGPSTAKRMFVRSLAKRERVEKLYTLVERDEVSTWVKLGFAKEGNIPGFYKRSDAFLLGASIGALMRTNDVPPQSETRLVLAEPAVEEDVVVPEEPSAAHDLMERTVVAAKKISKEMSDKALPPVKLSPLTEADAKKAVATALRGGRALTAFEPFGRDIERRYFSATARGGFEVVVSIESQACFGNAFVELLTAPKNDTERLAMTATVRTICDKLLSEGAVSCFSLAPSDDTKMGAAFVFNGFRKTGLLQNHIVLGQNRKDVIVWSRKLANPADE